MRITFKIQNRIDGMLEDARASQCALFGHVPHQYHGDIAGFITRVNMQHIRGLAPPNGAELKASGYMVCINR